MIIFNTKLNPYQLTFLSFLLLFNYSCIGVTDDIQVVNMKTEHLDKPLGIDSHHPRFTWKISDTRQGATQTAYRLVVSTDSVRLNDENGKVWDTVKNSSNSTIVQYNGPELKPFTRYYWNVTVWDKNGDQTDTPGKSWFETGILSFDDVQGNWISDTIVSYEPESERDVDKKGAVYYRKEFSASAPVEKARVYISSAGYFELNINGNKVGNHMLDPAKTRYDRRTTYVTHDVTSYLKDDENAVGVILGNGWYNHQSTAVWYFHEAPWRAKPSFWINLIITYKDGSEEIISSDTSWKTTSDGPIIFNSIYTGEHYDARKEMPDWSTSNFDDSEWRNATTVSAPAKNMTAQSMHPVRITEKLTTANFYKIDKQRYIFDLGKNISGISHLVAEGEEGTVLHLKHGEKLDENGYVDQSNINQHYRPENDSDPFQTDIFILSDSEKNTFEPKFNYKGFQYIEVTSDKPLELTKESLTGCFMHSDVPAVGQINTSNELINKIWKAGNQSYLSNLFGYPTDCPQREKLGWTGDGHIAIETGLFNFDGITIYEKWIEDHRDEQQPNGLLPAIIPTSGWGYHWANGVDWTSSLVIVPWTIYQFYGDSRLLAETYDNMTRYVDRIDYHYPEGLTDWGLGDWIPVDSESDVELTSTVYYYVVADILSKTARLFNHEDDYKRYSDLAHKIYIAFNEKFFDEENGIYGSGYQTELSMPLYWGLVPEESIPLVAKNLAEEVERNDFFLDVGLLGSKALLYALSENGYANTAYKVASQDTFPSWGWWIKNGATTFYENWSVEADSDISMNHIMFGEISAWFYKALGGINPDPEKPGFENIILRPHFIEELEHFSAEFDSPRGVIESSWENVDGSIHYTVTIPANSTATLYLDDRYTIEEKNQNLNQRELDQTENSGIYKISLKAGNYEFVLAMRVLTILEI